MKMSMDTLTSMPPQDDIQARMARIDAEVNESPQETRHLITDRELELSQRVIAKIVIPEALKE